MTPEEKQQFDQLVEKIDKFIDIYTRTHFIDKDVFVNPVYFNGKVGFFKKTPIGQQAAITAPSGGVTVDSQSRTAINSIISTLQALGITL